MARTNFISVTEEMEDLVARYRAEHALNVTLQYSASRGHYLKVPRKQEGALPASFMQIVKTRASLSCSTEELASLNNRQKQAWGQVLKLSTLQLQRIRRIVAGALPQLFMIAEALALADMLLGFCTFCGRQKGRFVRPSFMLGPCSAASEASSKRRVTFARSP